MADYVCIVGLDEPESNAIRDLIDQPVIAHITLPKILLKDGQLFVESDRGPRMLPVSKVIYHGIYEDDMDFISALALWGGPCLPNPRAMMDEAALSGTGAAIHPFWRCARLCLTLCALRQRNGTGREMGQLALRRK